MENLEGKVFLVAGAAGFVPSYVSEFYLKKGAKVIGIDNFHPYYNKKLKEANLKNLKNHKNFDFIEDSILLDKTYEKIEKRTNRFIISNTRQRYFCFNRTGWVLIASRPVRCRCLFALHSQPPVPC